jgi:outer membrane protein assembly factor BamB
MRIPLSIVSVVWLVWLAWSPMVSAGEGAADADEYRDAAEGVLVPASRDGKRRLAAARKDLQDGRYSEAVTTLQELLGSDVMDGFTERPENTATCATLKLDALRLLDSLPSAGREWYELQFGSLAQKALDEALQFGDRDALAQLSATYFHTEAGCAATLLLAHDRLDRGQARRALALLNRLEQSSAAARRCQPDLSLLMSVCWVCLGERANAQQTLKRLAAAYPRTVVRIGDEQLNVARQADRIVRSLDQAYGGGSQLTTVDDDWKTFRGDASRNAEGDWQGSFGDVSWIVKSEEPDADGGSPVLTAYHPLAIGGRILARTPNGQLTAIDDSTGRIVWEFPYELEHDPVDASSQAGRAITYAQPERAREFQWKDAVCGQMSSDGECVYLVDGATIHHSEMGGGIQVGRQLRSRVWSSPTNRLVALNLEQEGRIVWSVGGAGGEGERGRAGTFFLGPPVFGNDRLYALAEMQGVVMLVALQSDSGQLIWSQTIAYPKEGVTRDWHRRAAGATPSLAEGVLVCPTSAGAVVAVDTLTGRLLWGYRYPGSVASRIRTPFGWQPIGRTDEENPRWADAVATIVDGRVLVTSADSDELLCLDLFSGKLEWAMERGSMLYVACVREGNVVLVGEKRMTAVKIADGSPAWPEASPGLPEKSKPIGRGLRVGPVYYLPTDSSEILKINLTNGTLAQRIKTPNVPGNLLGLGDRLVWQSVDGVYRFGED